MADFNNNVFIKIRQESIGLGKITKTVTELKALNAELNLLISTVTKAQAVTDLDFSKIRVTKAGPSDKETERATTSLSRIAKGIEDVNIANGRLASASVPLQKALGGNAKALQEVTDVAARNGVSIRGATTSVKTLANGNKQLIVSMKQSTGAMFKYNFATKSFTQSQLAGGIAVSGLTGKIALQSLSIAGIIGKVLIWTAATTAVFGAINLLKTSLSTFTDFEGQLIALARVAQFSADGVSNLTRQTIELAISFGSNIDKAQEATVSLARLGLTATETAITLEAALLAEAVAEVSVEVATKRLISATNQFNIEISQSIRIIDEFNELSNKNAVTVEDLSKAVTIAGSVFNAYGAEIQDLNALTTVLAENTAKSGSEIGNALKTIGSFTFRPETIRTLERLTGIEIKADTGDLKELDLVLTEIAFRFDQFTEAEQNEIVTSIAGARQRNFGIIILKKFDQVLEKNIEQLNSVGSAAKESIPVLASFGSQVKQLGANFDSATIAIGETLSKLVGFLIPAANVLVEVLKSDAVQIAVMTAALAALGAIIFIAATAFVVFLSTGIALAGAFPAIAVAIGFATAALGLFAASTVKENSALRKFQAELGKTVAQLEKLKAVEDERVNRQRRTASILEQIAASARGAFFNAKGELVSAEKILLARQKISKLIDGVVRAGELTKKQADALSKDEKLIDEILELANQKRQFAVELQEKQILRAEENIKQAEKEQLAIQKRIDLTDVLLNNEGKLGFGTIEKLANEDRLLDVLSSQSTLTAKRLKLENDIRIQEQLILTANKQIEEVKLKIFENQLKQVIALQEATVAEERALRKIGALRTAEANKQLRLQEEFSRKTLDIFAKSDLDKSINELKILNESLAFINFQIDEVERKRKVTVDKTELIKLQGVLTALREDAKAVGEGIAKVSTVGIPIDVFNKFFSDSREVTRKTVEINKRLAAAFTGGELTKALALEKAKLAELIKQAEATDRTNLNKIQEKRLDEQIAILRNEAALVERRFQDETLLFLFKKNLKEKESITNAQKEALLLATREDIIQELNDIQAVRDLEVGELTKEQFISLSPETRRLIQEFNKPLFEDVQRQFGIEIPEVGKEEFDAAVQLAKVQREALTGIKDFVEAAPNLIDELTKAGISNAEAATAIQQFTERISGIAPDPADIAQAQGGQFFGRIAEGLTNLNESLQFTIISGIAGIAREISENQNVVIGVRLRALEQSIKNLTTAGEHDNN